jgi:hypothetical protein
MKKPIKLGMVGLGRAGFNMHLKEMAGKEDMFSVVAACDVEADRRETMAEKFGCKTYYKIEDIVSDPDVEVIDIATRSNDHFVHAKTALEAGKIVFLEKPMAMTYEEAKALDAGYEKKFGDQFINRGITVPTLEELLQLCAAKRPDIILGVEIKEYTEETVDLTVALLKKYNFFDRCYFYAFNGRTIRYIKEVYNGRTMGYPDFQMGQFSPDTYDYYVELGLSMRIVKSEILPIYLAKGLPIHMYCADTAEDVELCIEKGADLITANDPVPLMKRLGRLPADFE